MCNSQGNGVVGQVRTSPEILLVYRAHLVMIIQNIGAADMLCKGVKKLLKVGMYSSDLHHHARVLWQYTYHWHGIPLCIPTECVGQVLIGCEI
jgi:hypothetical protein